MVGRDRSTKCTIMAIVLKVSTLDGGLRSSGAHIIGKRMKDGRCRWRMGDDTLLVMLLAIRTVPIIYARYQDGRDDRDADMPTGAS